MSILVYKAKRVEALSNRARAVWVVGHGYTAAMHVILVWNTGHFHSSPWLISWPSRTRWPGCMRIRGTASPWLATDGTSASPEIGLWRTLRYREGLMSGAPHTNHARVP